MPTYLGIKDGTYKSIETVDQKSTSFGGRSLEETVTYLILSDNVHQDDTLIKSTPPLPYIRQNITKDELQLQCNRKEATEISTVIHPMTGILCILWEVTCTFNTSTIDADGGGGNGNNDPDSPLEMIPTISWFSVPEKFWQQKDVNNVAIKTKNGEPIFFENTKFFPGFTITKYGIHPFDGDITEDLTGKRNSTLFYGYAIGNVLCTEVRADPEIVNGTVYTKESYSFVADRKRLREFLHQGFKIRKVANGEVIVDRDDEGNPQGPRNLDADGVPFADQTQTHFLEFQVDERTDFNKYNLGPF